MVQLSRSSNVGRVVKGKGGLMSSPMLLMKGKEPDDGEERKNFAQSISFGRASQPLSESGRAIWSMFLVLNLPLAADKMLLNLARRRCEM